MNKKILLIVPTRGRPDKALELYKTFIDNSSICDIVFGLDEDDEHNYERIDGVIYEVNPRVYAPQTMNIISKKYHNDYEYFAFMGDDHRIRTKNWDQILLEPIQNRGYGFSYGDDLLQGEKLCTAVMFSTNIIKPLNGLMVLPVHEKKHLYADDFWMQVGLKLEAITYCPNVIIEHLHYSIGKSDMDTSYSETNTPERYSIDGAEFEFYLHNHIDNDIAKIKNYLGVF
jgi:hypothetical protein